jgi:hypothetical protein
MSPHQCICRECGAAYTEVADERRRLQAALDDRTIFGKCWTVPSGLNADGYPRFNFESKHWLAHRLAWYLATGHLPLREQIVCHNCPSGDNPTCWRNDEVGVYELDGVTYERRGHLWLGTIAANRMDCVRKGRHATGDRHPSRLYPEKRPRGDQHWTHRKPELLARGDHSGMRKHPDRVPRGEASGQATITADNVREIRRLYRSGVTQVELARRYGLWQSQISRIIRGESWAHVE